MLEQARGLVGDGGPEEDVVLARFQRLAFQEGDGGIEHRGVAGDGKVVRHRGGKPGAIIGDAGADALPRMG